MKFTNAQTTVVLLIILLLSWINIASKRADQIEDLRNEIIVLKDECIGVPK